MEGKVEVIVDELSKIVGKTIERVSGTPQFSLSSRDMYPNYYSNEIYIHFTDGTTLVICPDGYEVEGVIVSLETYE
jgi:hypothetical protein